MRDPVNIGPSVKFRVSPVPLVEKIDLILHPLDIVPLAVERSVSALVLWPNMDKQLPTR